MCWWSPHPHGGGKELASEVDSITVSELKNEQMEAYTWEPFESVCISSPSPFEGSCGMFSPLVYWTNARPWNSECSSKEKRGEQRVSRHIWHNASSDLSRILQTMENRWQYLFFKELWLSSGGVDNGKVYHCWLNPCNGPKKETS